MPDVHEAPSLMPGIASLPIFPPSTAKFGLVAPDPTVTLMALASLDLKTLGHGPIIEQ